MLLAQQIQPGQLTTIPATTTAAPAQFDINSLLTSIMPLIMMIMMFSLLKPMLKGMGEASK